MRIEFTTLAENDLAEVLRYIARDNMDAAIRVRDAILDTCDTLLESPDVAVRMHCSIDGLRRAVVKKFPTYLIFYRQIDDGIEIVRLGEGHRDWESIIG